ncbi:MAG: Fic family protein [Candidatus Woesearchaeota archaeon]
MIYHEVRDINRKKKNYLICNKRERGRWVKKAKFIGIGKLDKDEIAQKKKEFEIELLRNKKYVYLTKSNIEKIEQFKKEYHKKISGLKKEEYEKFQQSFFTELTYNSNAIEGSSLSLQETSLIINEGIVPEGKTLREVYEARNHTEALKFLKEYKGDLNELFILKLHSILLKDITGRFAGRYRESSVKIFGSDVKFPVSEKVPQLTKNLIYWYRKNKKKFHQFELAILVSMKLVTIHPFVDGNGRISRLVMNFLLGKKNYPWINIYNKRRQKYLEAVRKANDENYSLIFPFLIRTLEENLRGFGIV